MKRLLLFVTILTLLAPQGAWADITTHGELVSAINNASDGGTVTIGANFYLEDYITVDKNLTIDFNNHLINSSGYTIIVSNRKTLILTSENQGGIAGAAVTSPVSLRSDGKAYLKNNAYAEGIAYSNAARRLTIVFGDGDTTGIQTSPLTSPLEGAGSVSAWYSLDGRQLEKAPTRKGLYIKSGRKVVVK